MALSELVLDKEVELEPFEQDRYDRLVATVAGKPVGIVGASSGRWGTRLAQGALRQVLTATESLVLAQPMLHIRDAAQLFDSTGQLVEASTRESRHRPASRCRRFCRRSRRGSTSRPAVHSARRLRVRCRVALRSSTVVARRGVREQLGCSERCHSLRRRRQARSIPSTDNWER
jgi:hypothetical protein